MLQLQDGIEGGDSFFRRIDDAHQKKFEPLVEIALLLHAHQVVVVEAAISFKEIREIQDRAGAETQRAGLEQPAYYWDPVIAPSGAQFCSGDAFPAWRGSLFVGALRGMRLVIEDNRVIVEEHRTNCAP